MRSAFWRDFVRRFGAILFGVLAPHLTQSSLLEFAARRLPHPRLLHLSCEIRLAERFREFLDGITEHCARHRLVTRFEVLFKSGEIALADFAQEPEKTSP